jgi:mono/diheme cytochrome c family protein
MPGRGRGLSALPLSVALPILTYLISLLLAWPRPAAALTGAADLVLPLLQQAPAVYTSEQAGQGRDVYRERCSSCHGREAAGGAAGALAGPQFIREWGWPDRTLDDLFYITRTTMPPGAAGSLTEEEYLAVLAYVLQRNGYPPGEQALVADASALKAVRIESRSAAAELEAEPPPEFIEGERGLEPRKLRPPGREPFPSHSGGTP